MSDLEAPWLTAKQAAAYIGYSSPTVRRFCSEGLIRHTRAPGPTGSYRFRREWLDQFMASRERGPLPELKLPKPKPLELPALEQIYKIREELKRMK